MSQRERKTSSPTSMFSFVIRKWIIEQDHQQMERWTRSDLGFDGFWVALRTLAGHEAIAMIRMKQVRDISGSNIKARATFIASLFNKAF